MNGDLVEFFSSPEARRLHTNRLRYVIARWGYSPNLFAWELFNEIDLVEGYKKSDRLVSGAVRGWVETMAREIRRIDPFNHPITVSNEALRSEDALSDTCDFTQTHLYTRYPEGPIAGLHVRHRQRGKPHLITEVGSPHVDTDRRTFPLEEERDVLHRSLWASVMTGSQGTPMPWWWTEMLAEETAASTAAGTSNKILRAYGVSRVARELRAIAEFRDKVPTLAAMDVPLEVKDCGRVASGGGLDVGSSDLVVPFSLGWELLSSTGPTSFRLESSHGPADFLIPKYLTGAESRRRGDIPGINANADFPPPLEFVFGNKWHGTVTAHLLARSNTNANLRLLNKQDGAVVWSCIDGPAFPNGLDVQMDRILSAGTVVPSGGGLLLTNAGPDWVTCSYLSFSGLAPRFQVMGRRGSSGIVAWILDRESASQTHSDCVARFLDIADGSYQVSFFDCAKGEWLAEKHKSTGADRVLRVGLPTFRRDIALYAVRTSAP